MSYFSNDYNKFFKELAANNHKEWFDQNRNRYEKQVKAPFARFVEDLINSIAKDDKTVKIGPKEAIFRVNRDIRFSKDKTPYKTRMSAIVSRGGRKDMVSPGIYFELGPEHVVIYGGVYMPDKTKLQQIREHIAAHPQAFDKAINHKDFKKFFGKLHGEQSKVIPKELKAAAQKQPFIYNKQFYHYAKLPAKTVTDKNLLKIFMDHYYAAKPLKQFFEKALGM